ncbi:GNAT family N-acetyltransferase [Photobacterium sp. 1_MG-2023]|nr:GNAT family N-acetyltransferase [Photobacterium sp. 1_MG-2023]
MEIREHMEISLNQISGSERPVLENLFSFYMYELSAFIPLKLNAHGHYVANPKHLDPYWQVPDHTPYWIVCDGELAGFALVRKYPDHPAVYDMDQFFILRKFHGKGIGMRAFQALISRHPGQWQIRVLQENHAALSFWRKTVTRLVGQSFSLRLETDVDLEMHFFRFEHFIEV